MQADFLIECGADDEFLEIPWASVDGSLVYRDLKSNPAFIEQLTEVRQYSELGEFLRAVNSVDSLFQTAKCDAWFTSDIAPEEEIFQAAGKFGSYVDIVFDSPTKQASLAAHESAVRKFVERLKSTPELPASVEFLVRRCFFRNSDLEREGFYFTCYAFGFGNDETEARRNWGIALRAFAGFVAGKTDFSLRSE